MRAAALVFLLASPVGLLACAGGKADDTSAAEADADTDADSDADTDADSDADTDADADPSVYAFPSSFGEGSSVGYDGQTFRHLLIDDLKTHLGGVTARIDGGSFYPLEGELAEELLFYFAFDSDAFGDIEHLKPTAAPAAQTTYNDVSSGKDLVGKIAGNDSVTDHADWSVAFAGWPQDGVTTPESLVRLWIAEIDAAAVARSNGDIPLGPTGEPVPTVFLSADGRDRQQLLEKFLRGAVAFSQGTDDYLDDDTAGKGLLSAHDAAEEGKPWTTLEHQWDEGFGYFGAAIDAPLWSDAEIAESPTADRDGDGTVDLLTEVMWGHAGNAAKRDLGAVSPTDFTAEAWAGFWGGRALLHETAGRALTAAELSALQAFRDEAEQAWEKAIAATVVSYLNAVLRDIGAFGSDDYDFAAHAKHWSEAKGFALSFQFNPRSPLSDDGFAALHAALGTAPVLPTASAGEIAAHADALRDAKALLAATYGFDPANMGDDNGEGGW